ncbi:hypothetical protein N7486_001381 [Penicillium sp. IBT 16267x]|nr:hypothetical protein N7486_001381 [Penicillium sp. IBT 16267x]
MRTHSTHEDVTFDLIYHRTTLPLVNGGPDIIFHDNGKAYGWCLPACSTYGAMTINNQTFQIYTRQSLTWHNRQWSGGRSCNNWTWFHLHMPSGYKLVFRGGGDRWRTVLLQRCQSVIKMDP